MKTKVLRTMKMPNTMQSSSFSILATLALFDIKIEAIETANLVNDSRQVRAGDIFCAIIGSEQDGRQHIDNAIKNGAVLVLAQCQHSQQHGNVIAKPVVDKNENNNASFIKVIQFYQLNNHLFSLAQAYYQNPQSKMTIIGITGTNGKTSTSQIIAKLLDACQLSCAVIGTVGAGKLSALVDINNTTPGATLLHQLLADFSKEAISKVAMEVSSHALQQGRVDSDLIDIAVFTNLSRDHLDYHKTMECYAEAKLKMFSQNKAQIAIFNGDDSQARLWLKDWTIDEQLIVYGRQTSISQYPCYLFASHIHTSSQGVSFTLESHLGSIEIVSPLIGDFNVDNLLAAIAVLIAEKISLKTIASVVKTISPIIGRMESFTSENLATAVVDYAHTPDGLEKALQACRQHCNGELWVVFGCGGDRDKGKRALMAQIAELGADHVVVTNDNPRSEVPELIANDVLAGFDKPEKVTVMLHREQAVTSTLSHAKADDIVLLAGKGHEDYILMANEKIAYNEREVVAQFYQNKASL